MKTNLQKMKTIHLLPESADVLREAHEAEDLVVAVAVAVEHRLMGEVADRPVEAAKRPEKAVAVPVEVAKHPEGEAKLVRVKGAVPVLIKVIARIVEPEKLAQTVAQAYRL